jgi:hypothetical protein
MGKLLAGHFFNVLFDGLEGWLAIACYPGEGIFQAGKGPTHTVFFKWPQQRDDAVAYVMLNKHKDLYTVPTLFKTKNNRTAANASVGQVIYADADQADPDVFRMEPTMVVESSPNRFHLYWQVEGDTYDPMELAKYSRRIAHAHKGNGCDISGWDVGQLLRIPQSTNNKPHLDAPWIVDGYINGGGYILTRFSDSYPAVIEARTASGERDYPTTLPGLEQAVNYILGTTLWDLYSKKVVKEHGRESRRSVRMWKLLSELSRLGIPIEAAFVIAQHAGCNKYAQDGRPIDELWKEVCKAYDDPANQAPNTELDHDELEKFRQIEAEMQASSPMPDALTGTYVQHAVQFLSDVERIQVPHDTIVDRYVTWAAGKTDAAAQYQCAGILTVLATVFADFAYPATKFRMGGLNLWFMILGGTTRSRKSTARYMMLDTLAALETEEYQYDLGSDVTGEGLTVELADHPGRSKLLNRDEVHGMFRETGAKSYLSGLKETITELYDGFVRGRLRATTKKTKSARTAFNMFLSGVTEDVTETLTMRDFLSGFLARFLIAYAEPPERTPESVYMQQMDEPNRFSLGTDGTVQVTAVVDVEWEEIIADIVRARAFWEGLTKPGSQTDIGFAKDAWRRVNEFNWDVGAAAEKHDLKEALEPTADRMVKSVIKVACLLAMVEGKTEVEMPHVLKTIDMAEEWFGFLLILAGKIRESEWQRRQDEVEAALMKFGEAVAWSKAYNSVRGRFRPKEFSEIIEALEHGARVRITHYNGNRIINKLGW